MKLITCFSLWVLLSPLLPAQTPEVDWVARYNGPGNDFDHANALALDGSGNVYVTGYGLGSGTFLDYATIKYNASGVEQWVARYNGSGNDFDNALAIAIDTSGNVYVTGSSYGSVTSDDYATIKYDASGVQQWVALYNGPGNSDDNARALAVDGSGNVYVTGISDGDCATIKYDTSGSEEWVARYDGGGASDLVLDGSGNVYVTGSSEGDYATIKYDASGIEQWVARYNGPGNYGDYAQALALDSSGNVYVVGSSYDPDTRWDYATIKYDTSGSEEWVARYSGPGNDHDQAAALGLDGSGNVYVTGWSRGAGTARDYATIKYSASGVEEWVARYDGPWNNVDEAEAIAVDGSGNAYVTGFSYAVPGILDYTTIKYDASGSEEWVERYQDGLATALAVDGAGNVYVTGISAGDYTTIKYKQSAAPVSLLLPANGAIISADSILLVWRQSLPDVDRYWFEYATESTFTSSIVDSTLTDTTAIVFQLQHNETYWWRVRARNSYGWGAFSEVRSFFVYQEVPAPPALLLPDSGATGVSPTPTVSWNPSPGVEYYTLQLSDAIDFSQPTVDEDSIGSTSFEVTGLLINTTYYWRVNARNGQGASPWSEIWSFTTVFPFPQQVNLFLPEEGSFVESDTVLFVWTSSVPEIDRYWFEWANNGTFFNSAIDSSITDTSVVVEGFENDDYYWRVRAHNQAGWGPFSEISDFTVLTTGVEDEEEIPTVYSLNQNYPNPFNPSTTIRYGVPERSHVRLEVYNMVGQRVATLIDGEQQAGWHEVVFEDKTLASGLYLYRLQAGDFVETRKLILIK